MRQTAAPWLQRRHVAADQRNRIEMGSALKPGIGALEELPAPDRAVLSVARAVKNDAQHRFIAASVLGHAGGKMGMMMLDKNQRHVPFLRKRSANGGRRVGRVAVDGDAQRLAAECLRIQADGMGISPAQGRSLNVAHML